MTSHLRCWGKVMSDEFRVNKPSPLTVQSWHGSRQCTTTGVPWFCWVCGAVWSCARYPWCIVELCCANLKLCIAVLVIMHEYQSGNAVTPCCMPTGLKFLYAYAYFFLLFWCDFMKLIHHKHTLRLSLGSSCESFGHDLQIIIIMLIKELLCVKNALCNMTTFKKSCHSKQHIVNSLQHTKTVTTTQVHNKSL